MVNKKIALVTSALIVSGSALAVPVQGDLDTTSTGKSDVTIIKEDAVQITNVGDLDFGSVPSMASDTTLSDDVCVFSSTTGYNVTVTSDNGAFNLVSGTDTLDYTFLWNGAAVNYNTLIGGLSGNNVDPTCIGGTALNASFGVTILQADFNAAVPGTYTDTVTMVIDAE